MIFHSPLPDLEIPDTDFSSFVLERARRQPEKTALVDAASGQRVTYGELARFADAGAVGLVARGLKPGDVVAVCGFNTPDFGLAAHAVWRAGGTVVTVNPLFTAREMESEFADAQPRFLIATPEVLERAGEAARAAGAAHVLALGEAPGVESFRSLAASGQEPPKLRVQADDTALLLYSSGTTGLPKGVMLTHRGLIAGLLQLYSGDLAREDDVLVAISPFFHVVGIHGVLNLGLFAGSTIVTMARYQAEPFLQAIQRHRISSTFLTPPIVIDLVKTPLVDAFDLSSLRSIAFLAVGVAWGAVYAAWAEPRVRFPNWLSGLAFALLPLGVALVVVLPPLDGAAPELGPVAAASEALRHLVYGAV